MHCGVATPTDPGVPPRTAVTGAFEVKKVTEALAGRYKIEKIIGEGGMATVYLATDLKHKRKVAVKVMRPELAATLGSDRFLREVEIAGQLNHPHILPMYDSGESEGLLYYVMPYVTGETLRERLVSGGALPTDDALRLAREVSEALAYAHRQGIIHRDIKPANILLSEGHALVADFGIARAVGDSGGEALTRTGIAIGTPQYMAPEQATGEKEVDGRADVYATGAILYEMLAGEPPFTGPSARVILTRSLTEAPRALTGARQGISAAIDDVVQKALAKNPVDRYPTGAALVTALDGLRQVGMSSGSNPVVAPPPTEVLSASSKAASAAADARPGKLLSPRRLAIAGVAAVVLWLVATRALPVKVGSPGSGVTVTVTNRIAVLPFENQGAANDEYFAEGLADEVRGKLARVSGLAVVASSTIDDYKGSKKRPVEIGRELNADYVLLGKVRWAGGDSASRRVQVVPELIDVKSGDVRWQQAYDAKLTDVFEVQSQIASRVVGALGLAIGGNTREDLASRPTGNVAAYQLFLKARALSSGDIPTLRQNAELLEQAVALDSGYAAAWAALSITNARTYANGSHAPEPARRAKEALDRAAALEPQAVATHLAAARYYDLVGKDYARARSEIDLALAGNPNDADVLTASALIDFQVGNDTSALAKLERAREIDPRLPLMLANLGAVYSVAGRLDDAEETHATNLLLRPGDPNLIAALATARMAKGDVAGAHAAIQAGIASGAAAPALAARLAGRQEIAWMLEDREWQLIPRLRPVAFDDDVAWWGQSLATAYWQRGDTVRARGYADSSLAESKAQSEAAPNDAQLHVLYGLMLAYLGKAGAAREQYTKAMALDSSTKTQNGSYNYLNAIRIELALGNKEAALALMEKLKRENGNYTANIFRLDPTYSSLQGNPRYQALTR